MKDVLGYMTNSISKIFLFLVFFGFLMTIAAPVGAATIDFEDLSDGDMITQIGDVTFSLGGGGNPVIREEDGQFFLVNASGGDLTEINTILKASFSTGVTELTFEYQDMRTGQEFFTETVQTTVNSMWSVFDWNGDEVETGEDTGDHRVFSSAGIQSLQISGNNGGLGLNDLTYGPAAQPIPNPEPATMLLFGLGMIGLAGMGRKKFPM